MDESFGIFAIWTFARLADSPRAEALPSWAKILFLDFRVRKILFPVYVFYVAISDEAGWELQPWPHNVLHNVLVVTTEAG